MVPEFFCKVSLPSILSLMIYSKNMKFKKLSIISFIVCGLLLSFLHTHAISDTQSHEQCTVCHHQFSLVGTKAVKIINSVLFQSEKITLLDKKIVQKIVQNSDSTRAPPIILL